MFEEERVIAEMDKQILVSFYENAKDKETIKELDKLIKKGKMGNTFLKSNYGGRNNPSIEAARRLAMAYVLISDRPTYDYWRANNINIFHGTNANALIGISKYGLNSVDTIKSHNEKVLSGERWSQCDGKRDFISLTDVLEVAWYYMTKDKEAFPVLIGTSEEMLRASGASSTFVHSDLPEIAIGGDIPLETIKCICVPKDKVESTKILFSNTNIQVLGLANIKNKYFWCDCMNLETYFYPEEYEKYKLNQRKEVESNKITPEDLKNNSLKRNISSIKKMYNWMIDKYIKGDLRHGNTR